MYVQLNFHTKIITIRDSMKISSKVYLSVKLLKHGFFYQIHEKHVLIINLKEKHVFTINGLN